MKPWYSSKTIQNAIATFCVLTIPIAADAIEERKISETQVLAIVGSVFTLGGTIQGRFNATTPIKSSKNESRDNPRVLLETKEYEYRPEEVKRKIDFVEYKNNEDFKEDESLFSEAELDIFSSDIDNKNFYAITILQPTKIKALNKDSKYLEFKDYETLDEGGVYYISSYKKEDPNAISVEFKSRPNESFYLYTPHIELFNSKGEKINLDNSITTVKKTPLTTSFSSPAPIFLENPIYSGSHFSWAEATKNGERIPESLDVYYNIIKLAKDLDKLREYLGNKPMRITSWYRPPHINRQVGGSSRSSHIQGYAADFYIPGEDIWDTQRKVLNYWDKGGVGKGANKGFVHVASDNWYRIWHY
jgi:zinc D-Ala-D-Ala carboxypeptidase